MVKKNVADEARSLSVPQLLTVRAAGRTARTLTSTLRSGSLVAHLHPRGGTMFVCVRTTLVKGVITGG